MLDHVIKGGSVVDGTGGPARAADIGIRGDRIVAVGEVDETAKQTIDASGLVVAPGFIDPHTHYDAQLYWDGYGTPSNAHGVTSVIGGNCGFTLAPLKSRDADYTRRMMARVEGMPLKALESGVDWKWETFAEYLDGLEGRIGLNAGFMIGHCAIRRYVMGHEAVERAADADEVDAMVSLLHQSIEAGGLGLSTTRSSTHSDGDGNPVPSRVASESELLALCRAVGEHDGTSLEAIVEGTQAGFSDDEIDLLVMMSATAGRPVNWNVLTVMAAERERIQHQLVPSARAREAGARVVALTMPVQAEMNLSFGTFCFLWMIPGLDEVLPLPAAEKARLLSDPEVRARVLTTARQSDRGRRLDFGNFIIGDTVAPQNKALEGRLVADIARERGVDTFTCLVDIVIPDEFKTVLWPLPGANSDADWALRREVWEHPDVLLGGSDAGAHLDRMLGTAYTTRFLADTLRGRKLLSLERAVQLMTEAPARLFGLRGRGHLEPGYFADVVVFDPATVDSGPAHRVYDLPGDSMRLTATSSGVARVLVNGTETVIDGTSTGALPGTVLRSGTDTDTVATR